MPAHNPYQSSLTAVALLSAMANCPCLAAPARSASSTEECMGELLWNGVCLPTRWPPNNELNRTVVVPPYLSTMRPAAINCTVGRQLFVDDFLTQHTSGLQTVYHSPLYEKHNPAIAATEDWELDSTPYYGGFASAFSGGAFWNPDHRRYELFYKCGNSFCVAYSIDATNWTKPKLRENSFTVCKGKPCNVVIDTNFDGATVWLDLDTKNISQRYVMASGPNLGETGHKTSGLGLYTSPNGTSWSYEGETGKIEDRSSLYKDALRNRWVYSIKASGPPSSPGRTRRYWESSGPDVLQGREWGSISAKAPVPKGDPPQWLDSDHLDQANLACNGNTQLYNFDAVAYESVVIGLFSIITGKRCVPPRPFNRGGEQDAVYIGWSRDGFNFQRSPVRAEAFLPMSETYHAWNFQNVQSVGGGFLTTDSQLRFFVGARSGDCTGARTCTDPLHGRWDGNGTTGSATMRRDGFASISPATAGTDGVLTTQPLLFGNDASGGKDVFLFVNLNATSAGASMSVELLVGGKVNKVSKPLRKIDSTLIKVEWANQTIAAEAGALALGSWPTSPAQLRFRLHGNASLFSFWLTHDGTCGTSGGPVAGGGLGFEGAWDHPHSNGQCGSSH